MNQIIQNITGMGALTDQVVATDLLVTAKSGIKNYSVAITEASTPEVRATLQQHLNEAINLHEQITNYMINKGYYHPYNIQEQIAVDQQAAQTALNLS